MKLIVLDHDFPYGCTLEYQVLNNVALGSWKGGSDKYLTSVDCPVPKVYQCHWRQ